MTQINLFYSKSKETYYWIGSDECNKCHDRCKVYGLLLWDYWQHNFLERIFCFDCKAEILKAGGKYKEFKQVIISFKEIMPADAEGLWPERPQLTSAKGASVFDVASMPMEGVKTIDKTTLLARQSIWDAQIGANIQAELEEKDRLLSVKEGLSVLKDLRDAQPLGSRFELEDAEEERKRLK